MDKSKLARWLWPFLGAGVGFVICRRINRNQPLDEMAFYMAEGVGAFVGLVISLASGPQRR